MMLNASDDPARMAERINVKHAVQMMALVGILLVCETLADHTEQGSPLSLTEYECKDDVGNHDGGSCSALGRIEQDGDIWLASWRLNGFCDISSPEKYYTEQNEARGKNSSCYQNHATR
jgi:hypothetical protein